MIGAARSLTIRGRAFLTSGLTAALCGMILLERDLVRAGLVVAALPVVAVVVLALRRHRLVVERTVTPPRLSAGGTGTVTLTLTNDGGAAGMLVVEEQLPQAFGRHPRFSVPGLDRGHAARLEYVVHPELRGRFRLGPLQTRTREPFGLAELRRHLTGTHEVLVLPRVVELPAVGLSGDDYASGDERPRAFAAGSVADAVVRTYRRGDDLRRVHWRSTARVGELMVRSEEQLWQPRAVVLVDDRAVAHRGTGVGSSLETVVTAAASVVAHLAERGYQVRLITSAGTTETDPATHEPDATLEHLALIGASPSTTLPAVPVDEDLSGVVVVGLPGLPTEPEINAGDQEWWGRLPLVCGMALAMPLDPTAWGARQQVEGAVEPPVWLTRQGWRTSPLGRGERRRDTVGHVVTEAWRGLDQ